VSILALPCDFSLLFLKLIILPAYSNDILKVLMVAKSSHSRVNGYSMSEKIDITDVANWFLSRESMTHKKLQKLCYYAIAWGWTLNDKSIVDTHKNFQAWKHGPVSRHLYDTYKEYGWNDIPLYKGELKFFGGAEELLESVWLTYGDKGGNELEALSHSERPWIEARGALQPHEPSTNVIDTGVMKEFYESIKSTEY
jgi:uncharacterized phage-associated protein